MHFTFNTYVLLILYCLLLLSLNIFEILISIMLRFFVISMAKTTRAVAKILSLYSLKHAFFSGFNRLDVRNLGVLKSLITNLSSKFINSKWWIQYSWLKCKKLLDWDKIWYSGFFGSLVTILTCHSRISRWQIHCSN